MTPRQLGCLLSLLTLAVSLHAETASLPLADGFDLPVGRNGVIYHKARGFQPNGHLGEDWDGPNGGDTDLGDPVFCTAVGMVLFARDYHVGWGNVIIVRHAYAEGGETKFVDSLYGHLERDPHDRRRPRAARTEDRHHRQQSRHVRSAPPL